MVRLARTTMHFLNQAEVEGAIASYFGVSTTTPGISDLGRVVFLGVQEASRGNPAAWRSVVLSVLANHIGMAQGLGLQGSELQRQLQIMRENNRFSGAFAAALARVQTLVAGMGGWNRVAREIDGSGTTNTNTYTALGGYSADRLPIEMRRYADRYGAHHVAAVGNYLSDLGLHQHEVHRYAGFFVGSSGTVRHAIRDHVRSGRQITDADITSVNDTRALIGAVQAGRITRDALPPSMQRLLKRMERDGIDASTADPSRVQQYFDRNPNALEEARRANTADLTALAGTTDAGALVRTDAVVTVQPPPSGQPAPPDRPQPLETATVAPQPLVRRAVRSIWADLVSHHLVSGAGALDEVILKAISRTRYSPKTCSSSVPSTLTKTVLRSQADRPKARKLSTS